MRVLSLIVAILFAVGGARFGWACPSAAQSESCCCDGQTGAGDDDDDGRERVERACCCKPDPGTTSTASPPSCELPGRDRVAVLPDAAISLRALPPNPTSRIVAAPLPGRGPPPTTLLGLHTLLLC